MMIFVGIVATIALFAYLYYPKTPKTTAGATTPPATTPAPAGTTRATTPPSKNVSWKLFWIMLGASVLTAIIAPGIINRINGTPNGAKEVIDWVNKQERLQVIIVQPTPTVVASTPGEDIRWGNNYLYPGKRYYFDRLVNFYMFAVREEDIGKRIHFQKEGEPGAYWDLALLEKRNSQKENDHDDRSSRGRFYFTVDTPVMVTITQNWQ